MAVTIPQINRAATPPTAVVRIDLADITAELAAALAYPGTNAERRDHGGRLVLRRAARELEAALRALEQPDAELDSQVARLQAEIAALKAARPTVP